MNAKHRVLKGGALLSLCSLGATSRAESLEATVGATGSVSPTAPPNLLDGPRPAPTSKTTTTTDEPRAPLPTDEGAANGDEESRKAPKKKVSLRDPQDGMLDMSAFLDQLYGFVPVPSLITEPALGGIGGGLGLLFFGKRKQDEKVPPNIYALAGGYTANDTWMVGAGYRGFLDRGRLRVSALAFYGEPNLDFYIERPQFSLTTRAEFQTFGANGRIMRKVGKTPLYLGAAVADRQIHVTLSDPDFALDVDWLPDFELIQNQAQFTASAEFDNQNNFFSPTQGTYLKLDANYNRIFGDDQGGFGKFYAVAHQHFDLRHVVLGFRGVGNIIVGDAPFYLKPYVSLRGVPIARYQGDVTVTLETEEMVRIHQRFGLLLFGGWGKAMSDTVHFKDATNVWNVGTGFRYLMARAYGLLMGVDVARGPEEFAWYIQFGNAWSSD